MFQTDTAVKETDLDWLYPDGLYVPYPQPRRMTSAACVKC